MRSLAGAIDGTTGVRFQPIFPDTLRKWADELAAANARADAAQGMVDVLRRAIEAIDAAYDGPDDNGAYSTLERAALAKWEAMP